MKNTRRRHPHWAELKKHLQESLTWEHVLLTKIVVIGLAGLKMMAAKAALAISVMIISLVNFAPQYSKASDPMNGGGSTNGGVITAGGDTAGGRGGTNAGGTTAGDTAGGTNGGTSAGATTAGDTAGGTNGGTNGNTPTPDCSNGTQQGCFTNLGFPCQQGLQTCQNNTRGTCRPVGQTELCSDTFDNDCDGAIDSQDTDCGGVVTPGCTTPTACNYAPLASQDDGSCIAPQGCNQRCPGDSGQARQNDQCGVCGGDNSSCSDCSGTPNGSKLTDQCGACKLPNDPTFNSCLDCDGTPNGPKKVDSCNNCLLPTDPTFNACKDCAGTQGGTHTIDQCGACLLPDDTTRDSCLDCAGTPHGKQTPGTACDDTNPKTIDDVWQQDCSCAGTVEIVETKPIPTKETPIDDTQDQPAQTQKPTIDIKTPPILVKDTSPLVPLVYSPTAQKQHAAAPSRSPAVKPDAVPEPVEAIPVITSRMIRIPILTTVRERLESCLATNTTSLFGCIRSVPQPEKLPVAQPNACCVDMQHSDWSSLPREEQLIAQQLQERNCLFGADEQAPNTPQRLQETITQQEVEAALFHLMGGKVAPTQTNEQRRYRLQANTIFPATFTLGGGLPVTRQTLHTLLNAVIKKWSNDPWLSENPTLPEQFVTRQEALHLFGEVSQYIAAHNIDACSDHTLVIKRYAVTKKQHTEYVACRQERSFSSCSYILGLPTPKQDSIEKQIAACTAVLGKNNPDCLHLKLPVLATQHAPYDCTSQQMISPSECASLVELYTQTQGDTRKNNDGWLSDANPCARYGVTCYQGNVSHLLLVDNNLHGRLPELYFPALKQLQLQDNLLFGNIPRLPESTAIEKVILHNNALVGTIPTIYGSRTSLTTLYLGGGNQLCGTIPKSVRTLPIALANTDIDTLQFALTSCQEGTVCNDDTDCNSTLCNDDHLCAAQTTTKEKTQHTLTQKAHEQGFTTQSVMTTNGATPGETKQIATYISCLTRGHSDEQCKRVLVPRE